MGIEQKLGVEEVYEERLATALQIVKKFGLEKYINVLTDYWSQNPPPPGHGFLHIVSVATEAYRFGVDNNHDHPQYLFLGGLFHDVYRPAEGKHGDEDQTPGAKVVKKLFEENDLDHNAKNLIIGAIESHDDWRGQDNPPIFDLLLSLGDKAVHDSFLTDSYVWINNRKRELENKEPVYSNHLQTLTSFYKYQLRAWEILTKYKNIKGIERPINRYLDIVEHTIQMYREDPDGINFNKYVEMQKNMTKNLEIKYLSAFKIGEEVTDKILKLYDL